MSLASCATRLRHTKTLQFRKYRQQLYIAVSLSYFSSRREQDCFRINRTLLSYLIVLFMMLGNFKLYFNILIAITTLITCVNGSGTIRALFLSNYAKNVRFSKRYYILKLVFFTEDLADYSIDHYHEVPPRTTLYTPENETVETGLSFDGRLMTYFNISLESYSLSEYYHDEKLQFSKSTIHEWTEVEQRFNVTFPEIDSYRETFIVRVICEESYYKPRGCATYCEPMPGINDIVNCTEEGVPICKPGFSQLQQRHFLHTSSLQLRHRPCLRRLKGTDCTEDVDECIEVNICKNGGKCLNIRGSFACSCRSGFHGPTCAEDVDECVELTGICKNGGSCKNAFGNFSCNCTPNYRGRTCDVDVDECGKESSVCQNGGTCNNTMGSFVCICPPHYEGQTCAKRIGECTFKAPCQNDGICINWNKTFYCNCTANFSGKYCEHWNPKILKASPYSLELILILVGVAVSFVIGAVIIRQRLKIEEVFFKRFFVAGASQADSDFSTSETHKQSVSQR